MNGNDRGLTPNQEARLEYGPGEFRVVRAGAYVRCAVTGQSIRLEDLKYWSVVFQEAYANPEAVLTRLKRDRLVHM